MRIVDVMTSPWAIAPEKFREIESIYITHLRGEKIDLKAVEAKLGRPLENSYTGMQLSDSGIAVIPIDGALVKKGNMFTEVSGMASMQMIQADIESATADPRVKGIVFAVDSPGGTVDGTQALADAVRAASATKPTISVAEGLMASAGYWVGSAAGEVWVADQTTMTGSIGVIGSHTDYSQAQAKAGVIKTDIYAGKYKAVGSPNKPLDEESKAVMQERIDALYSVFVNAVAEHRGVSADLVLSQMADGRVFVGSAAVDAGLADRMGGVADAVQALADGYQPRARVTPAKTPDKPVVEPAASTAAAEAGAPEASATNDSPNLNHVENQAMTLDELKAKHPEMFAQVLAEGAAAEAQRQKDIDAVALPGHEALVAQLKADGKTTGAQAAQIILAAEKSKRETALAAIRSGAPAPVAPSSGAAASPEQPKAKVDESLPVEERAAAEWDSSADVRAEFDGDKAAFVAFYKANAKGLVKIQSKRVQ